MSPTLSTEQVASSNDSSYKRAFDVAFALAVAGCVLIWLIPLLAVLIKLESKGPIFFRQLRTGKDGIPFYCFKFRSMYLNDDANHKQASRGDSRITKVGAFLRKTSLDELPQFINVLLGDMSVVGPRPHMLQHTEAYSRIISNYMMRHTMRPGITGLAQVAGHRGETKDVAAMVNRVNADIHYLQHWSLAMDIKIVGLTAYQMVRGNENAF
jgi:putative colanic acid biosynthesis UDP-glucose lipid carrier transferase